MQKSESHLRADALGLLATAALTAAYMGPALSIYALFGPMYNLVGNGVGFVMFLGLVMTLPSAVSLGMLAKEIPSAGGIYTWTRQALGEGVGLWIGLVTASYYTLCIIFPPIIFGQFFNELLEQVGLHSNFATWLLGACILLAIAGTVTYRGIMVSSELAFAMLMTELAVVIGLAATFVVRAVLNGTFTWAPFIFSGVEIGSGAETRWQAIYLALPMALLSLVCDAVTPASEETRNAKWTIPIAVVLTCVLVGVWYVLGFGAFALAAPVEEVRRVASLESASPIIPLAQQAWGKFKLLVSITGMTAAMGAFIPAANAAARVLFAMSRDGILPKPLGELHPRFLAPWNSMHVAYGIAAVAALPACFLFGANKTIEWWGDAFGWFVAVVYIAANLANTVYYWRYCRERFSLIWNVAIPILGIAGQLAVFWQSMIVGLWGQGNFGRSIQAFLVLFTLATLGYAALLRRTTSPPPVTYGSPDLNSAGETSPGVAIPARSASE